MSEASRLAGISISKLGESEVIEGKTLNIVMEQVDDRLEVNNVEMIADSSNEDSEQLKQDGKQTNADSEQVKADNKQSKADRKQMNVDSKQLHENYEENENNDEITNTTCIEVPKDQIETIVLETVRPDNPSPKKRRRELLEKAVVKHCKKKSKKAIPGDEDEKTDKHIEVLGVRNGSDLLNMKFIVVEYDEKKDEESASQRTLQNVGA